MRQWFFVMMRTGWKFDLYVPFNSLPNVPADLMGMSERSDATSRRKRVKVPIRPRRVAAQPLDILETHPVVVHGPVIPRSLQEADELQ